MWVSQRLQLHFVVSATIGLPFSRHRLNAAEVYFAIVRRVNYASIRVQGDRTYFLTLFGKV